METKKKQTNKRARTHANKEARRKGLDKQMFLITQINDRMNEGVSEVSRGLRLQQQGNSNTGA